MKVSKLIYKYYQIYASVTNYGVDALDFQFIIFYIML